MGRKTMLTDDDAQQAVAALEAGNTISEIAASWNISGAAIRNAINRLPSAVSLKAVTTSLAEHLERSKESGTPPELYAWRARIKFQTLRRQAWSENTTLNCNSYAERRTFWVTQLEGFNPNHVTAWCAANNVPLDQAATWFHRIMKPTDVLLWGFPELRRVNDQRFFDLDRWADDRSDRFALGLGKRVVLIAPRTATEIARNTSPY